MSIPSATDRVMLWLVATPGVLASWQETFRRCGYGVADAGRVVRNDILNAGSIERYDEAAGIAQELLALQLDAVDWGAIGRRIVTGEMSPMEKTWEYCANESMAGYPCKTEGCPYCGGPDKEESN